MNTPRAAPPELGQKGSGRGAAVVASACWAAQTGCGAILAKGTGEARRWAELRGPSFAHPTPIVPGDGLAFRVLGELVAIEVVVPVTGGPTHRAGVGVPPRLRR